MLEHSINSSKQALDTCMAANSQVMQNLQLIHMHSLLFVWPVLAVCGIQCHAVHASGTFVQYQWWWWWWWWLGCGGVRTCFFLQPSVLLPEAPW
jgi:hypothetical protein